MKMKKIIVIAALAFAGLANARFEIHGKGFTQYLVVGSITEGTVKASDGSVPVGAKFSVVFHDTGNSGYVNWVILGCNKSYGLAAYNIEKNRPPIESDMYYANWHKNGPNLSDEVATLICDIANKPK